MLLYYFCPHTCLGLFGSSKFLIWELRGLIGELSFAIYTFSVINFPLTASLSMPHKFWYVVFSFNSVYLNFFLLVAFFLTYGLFRIVLFSFQMLGDFPIFYSLLISNVIPLWLVNTLYVISVLLNLLSFVVWPRIWSILVYVPWAPEQNMYSTVVEQVFCKCPLDLVSWWCILLNLCWFSVQFYQLLREEYWSFQL